MQMNGNAQIIEALEVDDSGIGYVSAGYVANINAQGGIFFMLFSNSILFLLNVSPLDFFTGSHWQIS